MLPHPDFAVPFLGIQIAGGSHQSADKVPRAPERRHVFFQVVPDKLWIRIIDQISCLPKINQFIYKPRHAFADGNVLVMFSVFFDEGNSSGAAGWRRSDRSVRRHGSAPR